VNTQPHKVLGIFFNVSFITVVGWVSDDVNYCVDAKLSSSSASESDTEMAEAELGEDGEGHEAKHTTLALTVLFYCFKVGLLL
jgi:hypothetical protein